MSQVIIFTIVSLVAIGAGAAIILYFVARKFKVFEDPRIDQVEEALPAANCGGCGFAGCRNRPMYRTFLTRRPSNQDKFALSHKLNPPKQWQMLLRAPENAS
jgi:hypothetical protein